MPFAWAAGGAAGPSTSRSVRAGSRGSAARGSWGLCELRPASGAPAPAAGFPTTPSSPPTPQPWGQPSCNREAAESPPQWPLTGQNCPSRWPKRSTVCSGYCRGRSSWVARAEQRRQGRGNISRGGAMQAGAEQHRGPLLLCSHWLSLSTLGHKHTSSAWTEAPTRVQTRPDLSQRLLSGSAHAQEALLMAPG